MKEFLTSFVLILQEMAPYLLLGFFIAGLLHAFVPKAVYRKWLSGNDVKSVLLSILFGVPLPLCSCGVIPTAVSMRKEGASKGSVTAFLIATPQTGVDSIAATYSVLGLPFAILRPLAAMVTGFFGGLAANIFSRKHEAEEASQCCTPASKEEKRSFAKKMGIAFKYGYYDMIQDIGRWLVIGLIIAGLIGALVPKDFFVEYANHPMLNMLLILAISVPMYVCATGSIPIAAALMMKGLDPGSALVFLMAGPATNMAAMMVLGKTLGKKNLIIYLTSIVIGALAFALVVDYVLPQEWFIPAMSSKIHSCQGTASSIPWWKTASAIALAVLLVIALIGRFRKQIDREETNQSNMKEYIVTGMACNHCKANVQSHLETLEGVTSVEVDLASGTAKVEGDVAPEKVVAMVTSLGYGCSEK